MRPACAADKELAAVALSASERVLQGVVRGSRDQRPDQDLVVERVTDGQCTVRRDQPLNQGIGDIVVHDEPA